MVKTKILRIMIPFQGAPTATMLELLGEGDTKGEKMQENWDVSCSGDSHDGGKDGYVEDYDPFQ